MRGIFMALLFLPAAVGCERFVVGTKVIGPVETRLDTPPVSLSAGHVKPVVVQPGPNRIALIDVDGLILNTPFVGPLSVGENPVAFFREKLETVSLRSVRQGGRPPCEQPPVGGVAACISMRHDLERFKERTHLPVVACLMDTAAGGAYYLASGADHIVAGPATVTGGIGVILNLFNLRDLMGQFNVIPQPIKSGNLTDIGSSARALTDGEKAILQTMADEFHKQIIADVKRARPAATDATTFDGRICTGSQAVTRGLADQIGDLDEAIQMAAQLGCPGTGGRPGVVMYRRDNDPARTIYAVTPNIPLQGAGLLPNLPGLDRSKMPTFLSVWQPELTMEKLGGK